MSENLQNEERNDMEKDIIKIDMFEVNEII